MLMNEGKDKNYKPENIIQYQVAVAVVEKLETEGLISQRDKRKIITALNRKYGFDSCSIFAA